MWFLEPLAQTDHVKLYEFFCWSPLSIHTEHTPGIIASRSWKRFEKCWNCCRERNNTIIIRRWEEAQQNTTSQIVRRSCRGRRSLEASSACRQAVSSGVGFGRDGHQKFSADGSAASVGDLPALKVRRCAGYRDIGTGSFCWSIKYIL